MNLLQEVRNSLKKIGPGYMLSTAYDTAWIARLVEIGEPMGEQALNWLRGHQLPDGSWGATEPCYYHDRMVSTLAAMTTLAHWGNAGDQLRIQRARLAVDTTSRGLAADPIGETIGFEMIVPTLISEAMDLKLLNRQDDPDLGSPVSGGRPGEVFRRRSDDTIGRLTLLRQRKLQSLPKGKISREFTLAFSTEMVGPGELDLLDVENLQECNGSVGHSPSATAFFLLNVDHQNQPALNYLRHLATNDGGGMPNVAPFDVFERSWCLWNYALAGVDDKETRALYEPHLDYLQKAWLPGVGISFAAEYTPKDSDCTALVFDTLARFGCPADLQALLHYELESHFRCYDLERDPSISANIHILGALRQAGFKPEDPAVQKIIRFLDGKRYLNTFWFDKWNISPYYPTTHMIINAEGFVDGIVANAVEWVISTQNPDGSWGYYCPTAEETAYCLQALIQWQRATGRVPQAVIDRGLDWLALHAELPYPPLWIGKCLYCPVEVVRSAIISALIMGTQG